MKAISEETSIRMWKMKAFAILAVVSCHCVHVGDNTGAIWAAAENFFNSWMGLGVPVFFLLAGYVFKYDDTVALFLSKKMKGIVIPWIVTGTAVWLYVVLRKGGIKLNSWFGFVFQRDSYLWFLVDLMIFYVLFFLVSQNRIVFRVFSAYMIVAYVLKICGIDRLLFPFDYLGIQSDKMIMFWVGMEIRSHFDTGIIKDKRLACLFPLYFLLVFLKKRLMVPDVGLGYPVHVVLYIVFFVGLYGVAGVLQGKFGNVIENIGRHSFTIYLLHMPVAGIVSNLLNRSPYFAVLTFVRPVIVVFVTMIGIVIYKKIFKENRIMLMLIGERGIK